MQATVGVLLKVEGRGVKQDCIPYVEQLELPMFVVRNGSLILMYMASFMALVMLCASYPLWICCLH